MNLLKETVAVLRDNGYGMDDIESVQGGDVRISIDRFKKLANREYDDGYGAQEVAEDLVILLKDGSWLSRAEYDGSEWWRFNKRPDVVAEIGDDKVHTLIAGGLGTMWTSLAAMNGINKED